MSTYSAHTYRDKTSEGIVLCDLLSSNLMIARNMFNKDRNYMFYAGMELGEINFQWPGQTWEDD